jgi:hypothetical protein
MDKLTFIGKQQTDQFLQHFGIPGMKWGVRRFRRRQERRAAEWSPDEKVKREIRKKKVHAMSNAELKKINERMQLEKTYRELKAADISGGRKFVNGIVQQQAKQWTTTGLNAGITHLGKKLISMKTGSSPKNTQMAWKMVLDD